MMIQQGFGENASCEFRAQEEHVGRPLTAALRRYAPGATGAGGEPTISLPYAVRRPS
jgi:hypothetical protein